MRGACWTVAVVLLLVVVVVADVMGVGMVRSIKDDLKKNEARTAWMRNQSIMALCLRPIDTSNYYWSWRSPD